MLFFPARDEAESISAVVGRAPRLVSGRRVTCFVVDDGSTDATRALAAAAGADIVTAVPGGAGLGAAVRTGLQEALRRGAAVVAFCDADGEYAPEELADVIAPILDGRADYVVGSRFSGRIDRMLPHRRFGNRVLTRVLRWVARAPLTDGQSGYRALSRDAAAAATIAHDYNYAQVLTLDLLAQGFRYAEVPISYRFREAGRSFVKLGAYLRRVVPAVVGVVNDASVGPAPRPTRATPRPTARRVAGAAAAMVAFVCAVAAVLSFARRADLDLDGTGLAVTAIASLLAAGGMVALAWPWHDVLAALGGRPPSRRLAIAAYFAGEIGKYVPGGIWPVVGRAERARGLGTLPGPAYGSVGMSLGLAYLAAASVAALTLPVPLLEGHAGAGLLWALLVIPVALAALHPRVLAVGVRALERATRRPLSVTVPCWRRSVLLAASYVPAWLLIGSATTAVALALAPGADPVVVLAAAVTSWLVGFVVVIAPGGAGVREVTFAAACGLGFERGLAIACTARLVFIAVDVVGFLLATRALRRARLSVLDDVVAEALERPVPPIPVEVSGT